MVSNLELLKMYIIQYIGYAFLDYTYAHKTEMAPLVSAYLLETFQQINRRIFPTFVFPIKLSTNKNKSIVFQVVPRLRYIETGSVILAICIIAGPYPGLGHTSPGLPRISR